MILIIIFILLIILLIAEIFRYNRIKSNAFSEAEVTRAAEEQARKIKYIDPIITCRYCGAAIDTGTDKVCQHCGGPYDDNPEWVERHEVKDSFIKEGTAAVIAKREKKAQGETERIMKRIRKEIMAISVIMFVMMALAAFGYYLYDYHHYQRNEDVSQNNHRYVPADYKIEGDGVIYDKDGVKITVTGIYVLENPDNSVYGDENRGTKVGFRVENGLGKNISIAMKLSGINGVINQRSYIYTYDSFRKRADVTFYEEVQRKPEDVISEMVFDYIEVDAVDFSYTGRLKEPVYLHTTAEKTGTPDFSDKEKIYDANDVKIYAYFDDDKYFYGYKLFIVNNSGREYALNNLELRLDGEPVRIERIQDGMLPSGYVYETDRLHSYDIELSEMLGKKSEIAISFVDKETHLYDFSTGFMDVSGLSQNSGNQKNKES